MATTNDQVDAVELTMRDLLGERKKPVRAEVTLCLDSEPVLARIEAEKNLAEAEQTLERQTELVLLSRHGDGVAKPEFYDAVAEAKEELAACVTAVEADSVVFEFRALGGQELEELYKAHRPTDVQKAEFQEKLKIERLNQNNRLRYNIETFPPALISASLLGVRKLGASRSSALRMTVEEATELYTSDVWSEGERSTLLGTAEGVNQLIAE